MQSEPEVDCISQEDLLAQLGLNSIKKLQMAEPDPDRVVEPEPPKQSILELMKHPFSKKIMLSSSSPNKEKALTNGTFTETAEEAENIENKEKLILRLQNNLRNEEAKLMLLRKLYACQNDKTSKDASAVKSGTSAPAATSQPSTTAQRKAALPSSVQKQHTVPKGQKQTGKVIHKPKPSPVLVQKPPQPNVPAVQPRVVFLSQPRVPQPVVIAPKLVATPEGKRDTRQLKVQMVSPTSSKLTVKQHNAPNSYKTLKYPMENGVPKPKMRSPLSAEQSHAEAKAALRKQLEKTLLEIPLPKPLVQNWNFVPSVNTQNFTILVGLEGVVNHIMESQALAVNGELAKKYIPPKFCSQCDTDFTPGWRTKNGSEDTLCESCYTQQIKKSLKTEHTARLKEAFMKALKQEQEVEKKFQLSGSSVSSVGKTTKSHPTHVASMHQPSHPPPARLVYHTVHPQPQLYQPHHSIVHQLQHQPLQPQHPDLDSTHRQEPARFFTYVGQPPHKPRHSYTENERQREYLLDMIPSGHSSRGYRI